MTITDKYIMSDAMKILVRNEPGVSSALIELSVIAMLEEDEVTKKIKEDVLINMVMDLEESGVESLIIWEE